jgi:hypothetical protein
LTLRPRDRRDLDVRLERTRGRARGRARTAASAEEDGGAWRAAVSQIHLDALSAKRWFRDPRGYDRASLTGGAARDRTVA